MTISTTQLGRKGEDLAAAFLTQRGYRILERNYRNRLGEIDIIALHRDTVCFIEVKARSSDDLGTPLEAITIYKQRKIIKVALTYLKFKGLYDALARFDVVSVFLDNPLKPRMDILQNAFDVR